MIVLLIILILLFLAYWALNLRYEYWKKRGVPSPPASFLFGNMGASMTLAKSVGQIYTEIYNDYPNLPYVGYYKMRQPGIIIRDPELVKEVLIKQFSSFHDTDITIDEKVDPLAGKNPFVLKGHKWKVVKSQITPCFTSKKLKEMYPLIEDAASKLINYLEREPEASGENGLEARELCSKYSTEVVASCAFGLEGKSFDEADPEFRRMGKKIFNPSVSFILKTVLITVIPALTNFLKIKFFSDEVAEYFTNIVKVTLKYRTENNVVRNDFLDFLQELKKKSGEYEFTDVHIVSHALAFFTDGFETSAATMAFTLYEIAANSDVQEKLYQEIKNIIKQSGGKIDYETLISMPYLDAVVNESLRMHPPGAAVSRACTKTFALPRLRGTEAESEVIIELGTPVVVPLYALHYDPKYFPDPERFDPERFSETNKEHIVKGTYLPFGEGPRSCYGQRFGVLQVKLGVVSVLTKYEIRVNKKTQVPLEVDPAYLILHVKGGLWLNFIKREN